MGTPSGLSDFQPADREECGVIVSDGDLLSIVKVLNVAGSDSDYAITFEAVQEVEASLESGQIVGFMHTHLAHHECEPSDADFDGASLFPSAINLIYKPATGELCWYGAEEVATHL